METQETRKGDKMAMNAPTSERDWTAPATKGDLLLQQADLEGKIKDGRVEVANMGRSLSEEIAELRTEVADMDRRLSGEIAGLRITMAWMTVSVVAVLGGLITVLEFIS